MSIRTIVVIVMAVVCGLSAALGLNIVLSGQRTAGAPVQTAPVIIAKVQIPRGRLISAEMVELKQWPKDLIPQGALDELRDVNKRAALQAILPGEPLFDAKLASEGAIGGMASLIPPGKRAYTIQTKTQASTVAGFVLPGNLVDVLLTFRGTSNDETGGGSTTTLLQAVEVLAVGKSIGPEGLAEDVVSKEIESVTLIVSPDQVAKLDLGQSLGMLSLSMRNPDDQLEAETSPATISGIRFKQLPPGEMPPAEIVIPAANQVASVAPTAAAEVTPPPVEAVSPAPSREPVTASILTLRGQSWGAVRVVLPPGTAAAQSAASN